MALMDRLQPMLDKMKARGFFVQDNSGSNMSNGGHCGYKPDTTRNRPLREQQTARQQPEAGNAPQDYPAGQEWATGTAAPVQGGYTPQGTPMTGTYAHTSYGNTAVFPGGAQTGYQPQQQPQQPQQSTTQNNISYIPGCFIGPDGRAFRHSERVAIVTSVGMCYKILEFMRNCESVVFVTEQIADEEELQRCLDLLYGAAYAMGYTLTKVSSKSVYLLSPSEVLVVPYRAVRQMSQQDSMARWGRAYQENPRRPTPEDDRYAGMNQPGYGRQAGRSYFSQGYAPQNEQPDYDYTGFGYNAVNYSR